MRFTCIFENDGEKSCKNGLENEFCILPPSAGHCGQLVTVSLFKGNTVMQFTGGRGRNVG